MKTLILILIIFISLFIVILLFNHFLFNYKNEKFSKEEWIASREKRFKLIKDLIDSKKLIGLTKIEVRKTLGYEFNDINSNRWTYYIGKSPKILDYKKMKLFIIFNKEGKVVDVFN